MSQKKAEEAIMPGYNEMELLEGKGKEDGGEESSLSSLKSILWHGGSVYDAWFTYASGHIGTKSMMFLLSTTTSLLPTLCDN